MLACLAVWVCWLSAATASERPLQVERDNFSQVKAQAEKGDEQAQLKLASLYASGQGVSRDPGKAAKWHRKAAELGSVRGAYELALDYTRGFGVKADEVEAFRWFQRAAEQGMPEAEVDLGLCYGSGTGTSENAVEAARWFRRAADRGNAEAQYQLGRSYFEGRGVTKDIGEAIKWIKQAAERGNPSAENRLGVCYEKGEGVTRDVVQAHKWLNLAAAQDDARAADIRVTLAKVETLMTPEQISQAQKLAREFKPLDSAATAAPGAEAKETGSPETAIAPDNAEGAGFVNVKCDLEESEVYADGGFVGNPPAKLKLTPGAHVIEVKKAGYKGYRRELTVTAGSDLTLRVLLEKN